MLCHFLFVFVLVATILTANKVYQCRKPLPHISSLKSPLRDYTFSLSSFFSDVVMTKRNRHTLTPHTVCSKDFHTLLSLASLSSSRQRQAQCRAVALNVSPSVFYRSSLLFSPVDASMHHNMWIVFTESRL